MPTFGHILFHSRPPEDAEIYKNVEQLELKPSQKTQRKLTETFKLSPDLTSAWINSKAPKTVIRIECRNDEPIKINVGVRTGYVVVLAFTWVPMLPIFNFEPAHAFHLCQMFSSQKYRGHQHRCHEWLIPYGSYVKCMCFIGSVF